MEKWEYKVLHGLSEEELNRWGDEGHEIYQIILPPPLPPGHYESPGRRDAQTTVILKRRKP